MRIKYGRKSSNSSNFVVETMILMSSGCEVRIESTTKLTFVTASRISRDSSCRTTWPIDSRINLTHTLPYGKKSNFVHSQAVGMQTLSKHLGPALTLVPITSHLVTPSVPNISKLYPHLHIQKYTEPLSHHMLKVSPI